MIKNLIFDFGNVLFDLKLEKLKNGFLDLMDEEGKERLHLLVESGFFNRYERGLITSDTFVESLRRCPEAPISGEKIREVWCSIFVDFPTERMEMLLQLRKKYKVYLLSNINDLHLQWIHAYLEREHGVSSFEKDYFDGVYYSHLIGLRKPDAEIYQYILSDAGINGVESVFFDDLLENIEAAESVGIHGAHHPLGREIIEHVQAIVPNL